MRLFWICFAFGVIGDSVINELESTNFNLLSKLKLIFECFDFDLKQSLGWNDVIGWSFDWTMFAYRNRDYNYYVPAEFNPFVMQCDISTAKIDEIISYFGVNNFSPSVIDNWFVDFE